MRDRLDRRRALGRALLALAVAAPSALAAQTAVLARYDFRAGPSDRWELPDRLREISGLAADSGGLVLAHGDERATVFELEPGTKRVAGTFSFGAPSVAGDFEAIAVFDQGVALTTSDGVIFAGPRGGDGEAVRFVTWDTGVGRYCEVEGLAWEAADRTFLLLCKTARSRVADGHLTVFAWSLDRRSLLPRPRVRIPEKPIARALGARTLHPSDITRDPETGHYLIVAAREHGLIELTPAGELVEVARLRPSVHRQPEGLAVLDGDLLVADEGAGRRGTLSVYRKLR